MSDNRATESSTNGGTGTEQSGSGRLAGVRQSAADAYESTRERTSAAYQSARERAGSALQGARETARSAGQRTAAGIETNPMAAVVGGLAIGLVAGAVLPKTKREQALLGSAGRKIHDTAREAVRAAKDAGREQIDELGLSRDAVQRRLGEFTDRAVGAVKTSAGAAAGSVSSGAA
ncbi:hypothetical protein E2493_00530 [Sphingomonas parva]|uniref:DUF883 family protein n=1 Tax=Sphingomonas parva TaxID=2555898 RepID=A0A4Y8ZW24_9SPHN|nr:hypothetical protein [Sphingomonas parva]TFI60233.1 hypothetical protein E2493_00530 [Sphingomonas parva]